MKITRIVDHEYKTGESKGKRWTLVKVQVADGKEATGFGPVVEGDEVDLTYNPQYKNYSFKLLGPQDIPSKDIRDDSVPDKPPADKAYLRDASTIPLDVYRVVANIRGLPENAGDSAKFWEIVTSHAEELMGIIERVRNSGHTVAHPTASGKEASPPEPAAEPKYKFNPATRMGTKEPELMGEEEIPQGLFEEEG